MPQPTSDGIHDVPAGKIATIATYLEMRREEVPTEGAKLDGLQPLRGDLARYRRLYTAVGEPWLWFSRSIMPDSGLRAIIENPKVEALAFVQDDQDLGLLELDFRADAICELAFFGLAPTAIGRGFGSRLIREGIRRAFLRPIERLWLHTCTLDHPGALRFYMRAGFRPYRRAVEIADDPRLSGRLPRTAAPAIPIL